MRSRLSVRIGQGATREGMARAVSPVKIEVVAYSGYKANERPLSFVLDQKRRDVMDVLDRWYGVEHDYFKVLADDGKVYLIRRHRLLDLWFLVKIMDPGHRPIDS
jgi:hypothetical protein